MEWVQPPRGPARTSRGQQQQQQQHYRRHLVFLGAAVLYLVLSSFAQPALSQGTCTAKCPKGSTCSSYNGAPVCKCPNGQRFINRVCTTKALPHSDWLDWMQNARAAVGSPELVWDDSLAALAQSYAVTLGKTKKCPLTHKTPKNVGQTLAGGPGAFDSRATNTTVVLKWVAEGALYNYAVFDGKAGGCTGGNWKKCGHYLQIIWSTTSAVGCGVAPCLSGGSTSKVWACDYKPAGNVYGRYPYVIDPCFGATCPAPSTCNGTTGQAVCQCPAGQVFFNNGCIPDPCVGFKGCSGDLICSSATGTATCVCPSGRVPRVSGSTVCITPECVGVTCPVGSSCAATSGVPYCACPAGSVLQNGICTSTPTSPVVLTSVALYSSTGNSLVVRFTKVGQCVKLKGFKISAYSILWSPPGTLGGGAIPGQVTTATCNKLNFWSKGFCTGKASGWKSNQGTFTKKGANGLFASALSIKCS